MSSRGLQPLVVCVLLGGCPTCGQPASGHDPAGDHEPRDRATSVDRIELASGRVIEGWILDEDHKSVRVRLFVGTVEGEVSYARSEIVSIVRDTEPMQSRAFDGSAADPTLDTDALSFSAVPIHPDRLAIASAISAPYMLRGHEVVRSPSVANLTPFRESTDTSVRQVAALALGIHSLYELLNATSDYRAEAVSFMVEAIVFAIETVDSPIEDKLKQAVDVINDPNGGIRSAISRLNASAGLAVDIQAAQNQLRRAVRAMLLPAGYPELPGGTFDISFEHRQLGGGSPEPYHPGAIMLVNRSGLTLSNVGVIIDVENDLSRVNAIHQRQVDSLRQAGFFEAMVGVDPQSLDDRIETLRQNRDRILLGHGAAVMIQQIAPGERVRIDFVPLGDAYQIVESIRVTVVADRLGYATEWLNVEAIRGKIQRLIDDRTARAKAQNTHDRPRRR